MLLWSTVLLTASKEKRTEKERGRRESVSCPSFILDSCDPKQMGLELMTSDSGREMTRKREEREVTNLSVFMSAFNFAHKKRHGDNADK